MKIFGYMTLAWFIFAGISIQANADCPDQGRLGFICGLKGPEDLYHIPNTHWLLASHYGVPGELYLINTNEKSWKALPVTIPEHLSQVGQEYQACPSLLNPDNFKPAGINVRLGKNGKSKLYVVNHSRGGSIEIFDLDTSTPVSLTWLGCILTPENTFPNSITPLTDGSLVITSTFNPKDKLAPEKAMNGNVTGEVLEWSYQTGWKTIPGGELSGNNGIEASEDGRWLYIAASGGGTLTRLSRGSGKLQKTTIKLNNLLPDNIRWGKNGSLLIAGRSGNSFKEYNACVNTPLTCSPSSGIVSIDPETFIQKKIAIIIDTPNFSAATVAVEVNDEIFVGSHHGKAETVAYFPVEVDGQSVPLISIEAQSK